MIGYCYPDFMCNSSVLCTILQTFSEFFVFHKCLGVIIVQGDKQGSYSILYSFNVRLLVSYQHEITFPFL